MNQTWALIVSLGIEVPIALWLCLRWGAGGARWRLAALAAGATLLTHPLAWHGILALAGPLGFWPAMAGVELAVFLVEAVVYLLGARVRLRHALAISGAANLASALFGLLVNGVLGALGLI